MIKPGVFLLAFPRPDGLYDAFLPYVPDSGKVAVLIRVGDETVTASTCVVDVGGLIGLAIGAMAGIAGNHERLATILKNAVLRRG